MLIRELLSESKKNRSAQDEIRVQPVLASTFQKSIQNNVQNTPYKDAIAKNLAKFIDIKKRNPFVSYPGVDLDFDHSNPYAAKKIRHAKMGFDHRLFYALNRKDTVVYLVLFGIYTHDHSGIGTKQNRHLQQSLADQFDQAKNDIKSYRELSN